MKKPPAKTKKPQPATVGYSSLVGGVSELLEAARRTSVRSVNALIPRPIVSVRRITHPALR
jgi:hypothetical protein